MSDFRQCRIEAVKYRREILVNNPVNMDKVCSFYKTQYRYYTDNEGIPAICFIFGLKEGNKTWDAYWRFDDEMDRNRAYTNLLEGLKYV